MKAVRADHRIIADIVHQGARVLDLGCGDGELLELLARERDARVQGIEIDESAIYRCVARGLNVIHSDIDSGLAGHPDGSFDYVVLNHTLQQVKRIDHVLDEALRAGCKVVVGFPNFAHIAARIAFCFTGRTPVTLALPFKWHETPNLRFLSVRDFFEYCAERHIPVLERHFPGLRGATAMAPNLFATNAVVVLSRKAAVSHSSDRKC